MQNEHQYTFDFSPPEFIASLRAREPDQGAHPALRNVVYLIGCFFQGGQLAALEPVFLRRVKEYMRDAVAYVDRLVDFIEASVLLSCYYFYRAR